MTNAIPITSMPPDAMAAKSAAAGIGVTAFNKSNDVVKTEGAALVEMIEASLPSVKERLLDTFA